MCVYIYIYIYIYRERERERERGGSRGVERDTTLIAGEGLWAECCSGCYEQRRKLRAGVGAYVPVMEINFDINVVRAECNFDLTLEAYIRAKC
jgi:hypothetical protein